MRPGQDGPREMLDPDEELMLAFRLEEEEQINRAILQSLHDVPLVPPPMASMAPIATETSSGLDGSSDKVEALVRLGFDRERAVTTLALCSDDLNEAANLLMNNMT